MSNSTTDLSNEAIEDRFDRIDELVSCLVDEIITDEQVKELEGLLSDDADMRTRYIEGVQLHCDLIEYYNPKKNLTDDGKPTSPVLSMLGDSFAGDADGSGIHVSVQPPKKD